MSAIEKLKELKDKLYKLSKDATAGKIDQRIAAEQIIDLRQEIDTISKNLSKEELRGK